MSELIGRLARHTGVYAIGNVLLKIGGLAVIPVYLNVLLPAEFGQFVLIDITARVLVTLGGLGIAKGLLKYSTESRPEGDECARDYSFTALLAVTVAACVVWVVVHMTSEPIERVLLDEGAFSQLIDLMALFVGIKIVQSVPMMILRIRERSVLYVSAAVIEILLLIGAVYRLVVLDEGGLVGILLSYVLSAGIVTAGLIIAIFGRVEFSIQASSLRRLIVFGIPLTLAALSGLFMNIGDRYLLRVFGTIEMVAQYDWAARLGGVVNMLFVQSFQLAFAVIGLKTRPDTEKGADLYQSVFLHYVFWSGWAVLGLALLSLDLTLLIADRPEYVVVDMLVFPVALGFMAYGLYYIAVNVLYAAGQAGRLAMLVLFMASLNAGLNVLLIPVLGPLGAALATVAAYTALALATFRAGAGISTVRYPWIALVKIVALLLLLFVASRFSSDWSPVDRIAYRLGLLAVYPLVLISTGVYSWSGIRTMIRDLLPD